jgi:MFS transporter, putative metabolite:H+ symporter
VPESPRWLVERGRVDDAEGAMTEIERAVKKRLAYRELPAPRLDASVALGGSASDSFPLVQLWSASLARRTVMIWLTWFFALLGFYGLTTWLSALLQASGYTVTKSVTYTILISLAGLPGFAVSAWLVEAWGRKATCVLMLLGSGLSAFLYGHAGSLAQLIAFGLAMQFFLFGMWSVLYAYTPELYPTRARATGAGCASAIGRVGSLIGPMRLASCCLSLANRASLPLGRAPSSSPPWRSGCSASRRGVGFWKRSPAESGSPSRSSISP